MKIILLLSLIFLISCENSTSNPNASAPSNQSLSANDQSYNDATNTDHVLMEQEFMNLVNQHRISIGVRPLQLNSGLSQIASQHSLDMANHTVSFGHDGFSLRCADARNVLGGGNLCAENVAMGQSSVQSVFNAWMNSPGHRANIEQARATHTGFGFEQSSGGTYYWTQIFIELN